MGRIKYGPEFQSGPDPIKLPFAASQYFHERGGALGYLDSSGHFVGALTATATVFGWALLGFSLEAPNVAGTAGSRYFLSSSTAAATKELVKPLCGSEVFWMPPDATPADSDRGNACDLIGVNDGTKQTADIGTSSTDILRIIDHDGTDVFVMVNPAKLQADT